MLVEQCLWSTFPSTGLHHDQQTDNLTSVLVQNPPDYTLLDPAPLSVQEKLIPPTLDSGITHHTVEGVSPPSDSPMNVGEISKRSPLHSILQRTLSKNTLVATVQLPVAKENKPTSEQARPTNFGSSLFEDFDAESASEYSDDVTSCIHRSVTKPLSNVQPGVKHFIPLSQAPAPSQDITSKDTLPGAQRRRVPSSDVDGPSDRNEHKASEQASNSLPPIPRKSTLRNVQRSITIVEPSGSVDLNDLERRSVSEPGHSSGSDEESHTNSQQMPLLPKPPQPSPADNPRLSWVDPPLFPSTSDLGNRARRSASTSNLPSSNTSSGPNKLRKARARTTSVSSPTTPDPGSRFLRVFRIRSPSTIWSSFRGSAATDDKGNQSALTSGDNSNDINEPSSKRPVPPPLLSSSTSGSLLTISQRSSWIPAVSTAATTPDVCTPSPNIDSLFIPSQIPPRSLYATHSKSLPSVTTSQLASSRKGKRKPAPPVGDLEDATPSPAKSPVTPDTDTPEIVERVGSLRRNLTRGPSKRRFWRSSTSINNRRSAASFLDLSELLPPVRPEVPFHLEIPKELQTQSKVSSLAAQDVLLGGRTSSSAALSQLAWTGLSSTELAALISRLNMQAYSPERAVLVANNHHRRKVDLDDNHIDSLLMGDPSLLASLNFQRLRNQAPGSHSRTSSNVESSNFTTSFSGPVMSQDWAVPRRRPPKEGDNDPTLAMRRWTLAMTDVPDEILVQELDRLRKQGSSRLRGRPSRRNTTTGEHKNANLSRSGTKNATDNGCSFVYGGPSEGRDTHRRSPGKGSPSFRVGAFEEDSDSASDEDGGGEDDISEEEEGPENEEDEAEWKTARKALFCCRELVRTEKNYQGRLRQLLLAEVYHPMYSLMTSYVRALLSASEALLVRLVDDPSAWGVSAAFIACEEDLEAAFVAWCGIVGEFFVDGDDKDKKFARKLTKKTLDDETSAGHGDGESRSRVQSTRSRKYSGHALNMKPDGSSPTHTKTPPVSPNNNGLFTAALGTGLALGLSPVDSNQMFGRVQSSTNVGRVSRTLSAWKRKSMPTSLSSLATIESCSVPPVPSMPFLPLPSSPTTPQAKGNDQDRRHSLRELAIQPTQRVMRYVLQYRDLLEYTPTNSPSRGLVERAHETASRIAQKCDRAQGNSAFLRQS